ncbi:hypothetical protein KQ940_22290 [Marinobacterium sp. D7]|uniref:hypothetical protein n=1 Tax=Marinobacterium ramblicola TaxID=2849041 RepID=UPI001C2D3F2E|nr:hypothetical protein [Marinobacterium ramblicola]MBV1790801.1 hypothetical protein [Marinobacterium ramblicola]
MGATFSPYEVREKLNTMGKEALLKEIPKYNPLAQDFYYKTLQEIEIEELEKYKVSLQEEANKLARNANVKAVIAIVVSGFAVFVSAAATIYAATLNQ